MKLIERVEVSWFGDGDRTNFAAMRILVALNALWIVLSRPDIPRLATLPAQFFSHIPRTTAVRFLAVRLPPFLEWALYALLVVLLAAVAANVYPRVTALAAALLLYRFAALEPLIGSISTLWFTCFTHLLLGLLFIAAASGRNRRPFDDHWPVAALQTLFALYYFFTGWAKLVRAGAHWATVSFRAAILAQQTREIFWTPWAAHVASNESLCLLLAITTLLLELFFPLVLVSRRARTLIVPAALIGHFGIAMTLGLIFLNWPLLFIYADWNAVRERLRPQRGATI